MSERVSESIRRIVAARSRGYCEYCRCSEKFATERFTVEHIKPRKAGGETVLENLAWSCFGCNGYKHTKTEGIDPETGEKTASYLLNFANNSSRDNCKHKRVYSSGGKFSKLSITLDNL
ncbi:HNH endonuclease [Sphaerospermopsis torques-reginae]|uniref:HNH endonuclease n=1 Tax=Sphaerospermopsis torques-reginae ITEP-024 TaxID=984208 RepID=A0ABX8WWI6_9CYAN|nr:HNH endonuclease signature motif containing protein [Sphaerospermopsis torques-reginae]QYX30795.1 HNH endonuclease [Sphaerospermopsis torques-reginae ITEP-024]